MMTRTIQTHLKFALEILNGQSLDYTTYFSKYAIGNSGQQYQQPREILAVQRSDFGSDWVNKQLNSLMLNQELAWHSKVEISGLIYHIPMIDFEMGNRDESIKSYLSGLLKATNTKELWCFKSGRSYHAYGFPLLNQEEWLMYLGCLLSLPQHYPSVDTRWIGYSLRRGYSALRWSNNTKRYKQMPIFIFSSNIV